MTTHTLTLRANQKAKLSLAPVDADGKPAQLDAAVAFTGSNNNVAIVQVALTNDLYIVALNPGTTTISAKAASFGVDVSEQINVTVTPAQAVKLGLTFGAPESK
jgi:hypothetical protein